VELLELATIIILSVALGLTGAGAILSMMFFCLRSARRSEVTAAARLDAAYEAASLAA